MYICQFSNFHNWQNWLKSKTSICGSLCTCNAQMVIFTFFRNRIVPVLWKRCGKTREGPVKYVPENIHWEISVFALTEWNLCWFFLDILKYKILVMIQKIKNFIDNLASNIWNTENFKNLSTFQEGIWTKLCQLLLARIPWIF